MKEKIGNICIALFLTAVTIYFFYVAIGNYTLVLFESIEIPELIFDILAYGMGALMAWGSFMMWRGIFRN